MTVRRSKSRFDTASYAVWACDFDEKASMALPRVLQDYCGKLMDWRWEGCKQIRRVNFNKSKRSHHEIVETVAGR